jgi:hypothetical protein
MFTQSQADALERAIAEGVDEVKYEDRTVKYRSLADMLALLGRMRADLAGPNNARTDAIKASFDKEIC